jgi:serine protease Do
MKRPSRPVLKRSTAPVIIALTLVFVVVTLAAGLGGCTLPSFSSHSTTTATSPTTSVQTRVTSAATTTTTTKRPTSTTDWRSTSSTARRTTSSTAMVAHPSTGDAKVIAAKLKNSVVLVSSVSETDTTGYFELEGTGVVYKTSGAYAYIITNNHVIERADGKVSKRIRVTLPSGSTVTATLIGRDHASDLAVLRVKSKRVTPAVFRTDLSQLEKDDFTVAITTVKDAKIPHQVLSGNVLAFAPAGELVQLDSDLTGIDDVIETDIPIVNGFSGGPLLDYKGRVIGINMAKLESRPWAISLPADFVVKVADRLMAQ